MGELTQNDGHWLRRSESFKVTDFGTSRKLICDFPLMNNTNLGLHRISQRFPVVADLKYERSILRTGAYCIAFGVSVVADAVV